MIVTADDVVAQLRDAWPDVQPGRPEPLSGGFWAAMFRVALTGQPPGVPDEVVVRRAPHRAMGAKEAEVQRAVAAAGFPTPNVWLSRPDPGGEGWWSVMDHVPGPSLLAGLDGPGVLRRAPTLVRSLPVQLAETAAALHRVDPAPVTDAVERVAPDVAWSAPAMLEHLRAGASALGHDDVAAALGRLATDVPESRPAAVCHGDLHPFNVLDHDGELVLIDWTGAVVADPCFDVAFTHLLLANPPLGLPRALAPVGRGAGRLLARRFVAAYARANPSASLDALAWFGALHSARVLVEVARLRADLRPGGGGHPFFQVAPAAARRLSAVAGVAVAP